MERNGIEWVYFDIEPSVRYAVLASLDERFDAHLAMAANLRSLFIALNDEIMDIRELVIRIIGRLSIRFAIRRS